VLLEGRADLGQLDVDDVAELALRVIRDADRDDVVLAGGFHVLMVFGIQQVLRNLGHDALPERW
jgi:hypothetical protein